MVGGLGPSSLCPTGVLPLLEVIATTGYDLAVVEGGTSTYSNLCAQTGAIPSRLKRRVGVVIRGVGRAAGDLERVVAVIRRI